MWLRPAEEVLDQALMIAAAERERLRALGVVGELVLTGGSSMVGALTRGDVDLHLRVRPAAFASVVAVLRRTYAVVHPEIWKPTLATFGVPAALEAGMAVTPAGSEHDLRFTRTWQLLAADPALLREYNAVKLADTADENVYEDRKSAFFDELLRLWPTHPAGGLATAPDARVAGRDPNSPDVRAVRKFSRGTSFEPLRARGTCRGTRRTRGGRSRWMMPSSARSTTPRPRCPGSTAGPRVRPTSAASRTTHRGPGYEVESLHNCRQRQERAMNSDDRANSVGFVVAADEGQAFWFLNTLTINKVRNEDSQGRLSIVDHRVPPGFAAPPHIHEASDEAFLVLDGEFEGFCGDEAWQAGPGSLVFLPHGIPHGFHVSREHRGRIIVIVSPGGFDQFVAAAGEPAADLRLPEPVPPDPARLTQLAAAHGIQILPPDT